MDGESSSRGKNMSYEGKALSLHLAQLLTGCVTLGKSSNLSLLQFLLL